MAVRTPHKVNAKTNLFSRKRDAVDVVPYKFAFIFNVHIPRMQFVRMMCLYKKRFVSVGDDALGVPQNLNQRISWYLFDQTHRDFVGDDVHGVP